MLRYGFVVHLVLLIDERDGDRICGVILGFVFEDTVAFSEANISDGDDFCLAGAGDFGVFA